MHEVRRSRGEEPAHLSGEKQNLRERRWWWWWWWREAQVESVAKAILQGPSGELAARTSDEPHLVIHLIE